MSSRLTRRQTHDTLWLSWYMRQRQGKRVPARRDATCCRGRNPCEMAPDCPHDGRFPHVRRRGIKDLTKGTKKRDDGFLSV